MIAGGPPPSGQPGELLLASHGARIAIRSSLPNIASLLHPHLPPGAHWVERDDAREADERYELSGREGDYLLSRGSEEVWRAAGLDGVLTAFELDVPVRVACAAREALFVHAGVAAHQGHAVLVPGRSMSGKSTLVRALLGAGACYYSDEYAVLDDAGLVHPYARRLSVRNGAGGVDLRSAEELGATVGQEPVPVGLIVVSRYRPGARWDPVLRSPGEAHLALMDNTVLARARAGAALAILAHTVSGAAAYAGERGEAEEVAAWIMDHLARTSTA